jgi:hypothetical protein
MTVVAIVVTVTVVVVVVVTVVTMVKLFIFGDLGGYLPTKARGSAVDGNRGA